MNAIDKTIEFFSPNRALGRELARRKLQVVRAYEAASLGNRMANWGLSKPQELGIDRKVMRQRARHLVANNPYAARMVSVLVSYIIGKGIIPHASGSKELEKKLKAWADTKTCDDAGHNNLYGLQALICRHIIVDGEVFVLKTIDRSSPSFPLKLRVIDIDSLDEFKNIQNEKGKNRITQGIEYGKNDKPIAYWFKNPNDTTKSYRVPSDAIMHIYRKDFASQMRGVTWFAPILVRLRDADEWDDATIMRAKISACIVGFFRDLEGGEDFGNTKSKLPETLQPGSLFHAPAGQTIEFFAPPPPTESGEFLSHTKHVLASALNIPYFLLTGDLSSVNYSSARMGMLNFFRFIDQVQEHIFTPLFCDTVSKWFLETFALVASGHGEITWSPPRKELTDPVKDIEGLKASVEAGFMAHSTAIKSLGEDCEETYAAIKASNELIDREKFAFSTDFRNEINSRSFDAKSLAV